MSKWYSDRRSSSLFFTQIVSGGSALPKNKNTGVFQRSGVLITVPDRSLTFVGTSCARLLPVLIFSKQTRVIFYSYKIMTTIHRFFSKALASLMLAGLCLWATSTVHATCPTNYPDYPLITWVDGGCYNATVDGCPVTICYCYRDLRPTLARFDYVVTSIAPNPPGAICGGNTWLQIIQDAGVQIVKDNPSAGPCPHCVPDNSSYAYVYTYTSLGCWKLHNNNPNPLGSPWYVAEICDVNDFCVTTVKICCDPGDGHETILAGSSSTEVGTACSSSPFPNDNALIVNDVCYHITGCGN